MAIRWHKYSIGSIMGNHWIIVFGLLCFDSHYLNMLQMFVIMTDINAPKRGWISYQKNGSAMIRNVQVSCLSAHPVQLFWRNGKDKIWKSRHVNWSYFSIIGQSRCNLISNAIKKLSDITETFNWFVFGWGMETNQIGTAFSPCRWNL